MEEEMGKMKWGGVTLWGEEFTVWRIGREK